MYEEYYGFVQPPFSLTPDPRFLYRSESHDVALQQVWQAIRRKEGFLVLTGDIGTGKTTLCRTILEQFDSTTFTTLILNPFVSVEELLREVLLSYGVASRDALRKDRLASASKHELVRTLHDFLLSLAPIHGSAVLIIDEAQHLSPDVLEEIRVLSNLETNEQKLLQIVFVGQLNLLDVLRDARLRQLNQRISIRCLLKPLGREETEAYITHRLWVARGSTAVSFAAPAVDLVHAISAGVPRLINLICDRALMLGCEARSARIGEDVIINAATGLGLSVPAAPRRDLLRRSRTYALRVALLVGGAAMAAMLALGYFVLGNPRDLLAAPPAPQVSAPLPQSLGIRRPVVPAPLDTLPTLTAPPLTDGRFSVLIGTYDNPRQAADAEAMLRARELPIYALDLLYPDGIRRRWLVGRYSTTAAAEQVRAEVANVFTAARVVTAAAERFR
jgi:general secretion pathway protein A